jgi:hypothetical protein
MLDFSLRVDILKDQLSVLWHCSGPENGLALLFKIVEEITEIFPLVDAQQRIIRVKFLVIIVGSQGGKQVPLFIRGERIHKKLIHFHYDSELAIVLFGGKEFLPGLVFLKDVLDKMAEVVFGLELMFELFELSFFLFPEGVLGDESNVMEE